MPAAAASPGCLSWISWTAIGRDDPMVHLKKFEEQRGARCSSIAGEAYWRLESKYNACGVPEIVLVAAAKTRQHIIDINQTKRDVIGDFQIQAAADGHCKAVFRETDGCEIR